MVKFLTAFGDRVLSVVVPQTEVQAGDTCTWQYGNCKRCHLNTGAQWYKRLCCTSQDGSYCDPWEKSGGCVDLATC